MHYYYDFWLAFFFRHHRTIITISYNHQYSTLTSSTSNLLFNLFRSDEREFVFHIFPKFGEIEGERTSIVVVLAAVPAARVPGTGVIAHILTIFYSVVMVNKFTFATCAVSSHLQQ